MLLTAVFLVCDRRTTRIVLLAGRASGILDRLDVLTGLVTVVVLGGIRRSLALDLLLVRDHASPCLIHHLVLVRILTTFSPVRRRFFRQAQTALRRGRASEVLTALRVSFGRH